MGKIVAAINMSIDGYFDHTAMHPDAEVHQHYTDLLNGAGQILYGRITYELMGFWKPFLEHPSGEQAMDDFAKAIDRIPKIVFSKTLKNTGWNTATISDQPLETLAHQLRQEAGRDVLVGSRSLILQLMKANLLDELQLCVHPILAGGGSPLFENVKPSTFFQLVNTKSFQGGAVILYYKPAESI